MGRRLVRYVRPPGADVADMCDEVGVAVLPDGLPQQGTEAEVGMLNLGLGLGLGHVDGRGAEVLSSSLAARML